MENKTASWSWIAPLIGFAQSIIFFGIFGNLLFDNVTPPTPSAIRLLFLLSALLIWASLISGLIFGLKALNKIKKNPRLSGRVSAVIGIIISILMIPYAGLMSLGPIVGD